MYWQLQLHHVGATLCTLLQSVVTQFSEEEVLCCAVLCCAVLCCAVCTLKCAILLCHHSQFVTHCECVTESDDMILRHFHAIHRLILDTNLKAKRKNMQ